MNQKPMTIQKKTGLISSAITVVVVVCLVIINLTAAVLSEKAPVKIDLTSDKVFQLSQASIGFLEKLDKPVKVTVLNTRDGFVRGGDYYQQAVSVLEQYAQYSDKVSVEYMDFLANPSYAANYPEIDLQVNSILVQCGEHVKALTAMDIFNVNWYGGNIASSKAEEAMTGAIMEVSADSKIQAVFLTGHGEGNTAPLEALLQQNGFETASAALLTEGVPQQAQVAILSAPTRDITEEEAAALDAFLENGGAYGKHLLYFASLTQGPLPNLESWLAKWGLAIGQGMAVETDPRLAIDSNGVAAVAGFDDMALAAKMYATDIPVIMPMARPIEQVFTESMGYTTKPQLSYSESAGIVTGSETSIDPSGPIPVAAMSTLQKDGQTSHVLAFGSDQIFDPQLLSSSAISNADYLLSVVNTLTQRENVISIAPKVLGGGTMAITFFQAIAEAVLLAIVLPLVVLIAGLIVWTRRKRR